jgi:hypothetical protein
VGEKYYAVTGSLDSSDENIGDKHEEYENSGSLYGVYTNKDKANHDQKEMEAKSRAMEKGAIDNSVYDDFYPEYNMIEIPKKDYDYHKKNESEYHPVELNEWYNKRP